MILQSGREIPDHAFEAMLDVVISSIICMYSSFDFEDFGDAVSLTAVSLQEDEGWLPNNENLTHDEANEVVDKVRAAARVFATELRQAYGRLSEKYIGTKSWELYRQ